jgi:hypothetical protein
LKIKDIRFKKEYGEAEIPYQSKTGSGPGFLLLSFPYVRDWLNEHPFRNEPEARLICSLLNGSPIKPEALWGMMKQLRLRISRLVGTNQIENKEEKEKLEHLLKTKKFTPYCLRHSSISFDSDYLDDPALKKKVRWSMNSRQGGRYIKNRMGNGLKQKILTYNGVVPPEELKSKPSVLNCARCGLVNAIEYKYCSECSYPLTVEAYDEIKKEEDNKVKSLNEKYEKNMIELRNELRESDRRHDEQLNKIMSLIQQNPKLANVRSDVLTSL